MESLTLNEKRMLVKTTVVTTQVASATPSLQPKAFTTFRTPRRMSCPLARGPGTLASGGCARGLLHRRVNPLHEEVCLGNRLACGREHVEALLRHLVRLLPGLALYYGGRPLLQPPIGEEAHAGAVHSPRAASGPSGGGAA